MKFRLSVLPLFSIAALLMATQISFAAETKKTTKNSSTTQAATSDNANSKSVSNQDLSELKAEEKPPTSDSLKKDPENLDQDKIEGKKESKNETQDKKSQDWYLGPSVHFGVPHLSAYSLTFIPASKTYSASLTFGSLSASGSDASGSFSHTEVTMRWHPFLGSFFLGGNLGTQNITTTSNSTISSVPVTVTANLNTTYMTPHLGWMWGLTDGGFFGGLDLGYQLPSSSSATITSNANTTIQATADYIKMKNNAEDLLKVLGGTSLPYLIFLKLGYLF